MVAPEIRMQRDAEQPAFGSEVHRQVEYNRPNRAIDDTLDAAGRFLGHEEIVLPRNAMAMG